MWKCPTPVTSVWFASFAVANGIAMNSGVLFAQDLSAEARALRPADTKAAQQAVLDDLEQRARAALGRIPHAASKADADRTRPQLRRKLEESLGFRKLPWPPDLRTEVTGAVRRSGYRVEKLSFQSLPDVRVAAHLYLPETLNAPAPAVLFYVGHWWPDSKMRPDFQAFCINMARMGFVVLSFDPFGQGERGVSSRDHRRTETLLAGISQQGIAEYETRSALEVLLARKEVDPNRIGMTGASGGGYNTWITGALDDRIKVVVPVVGTSEFFEQIHVTRPLDWYRAAEHCHFVPGLIRYANNHEFVSMVAPRPLMIIAASVDQSFPVTGVRAVHEYGRGLYRSYGAEEKIGYFEDSREGHGYQKAKREAAYGFFLRWLMGRGDGSAVREPETVTDPVDSPELRSFTGGKEPAGQGIVKYVQQTLRNAPSGRTPIQALLGETPAGAPLNATIRPKRIQRVLFETQTGLNVPAVVLRPDAPAGVLIACDDRGKEELAADPFIAAALQKNWMVWAVDPRGIGESKTQSDGWVFAVSLLLGENFVGRQGWDIARIVDHARRTKAGPVGLYARGHNMVLAATYALSVTRADWSVLREGFVSYRQFIDRPQSLEASYRLQSDDVREQRKTAFDREIPHEYFVHRAWESFDLPLLLMRSKSKITIVDPINGDWMPLQAEAARAMLPRSIALQTIDEAIANLQ